MTSVKTALFPEDRGPYGPLTRWATDPAYTQILVNSPKNVWVTKDGETMPLPPNECFDNDEHLQRVQQNLAAAAYQSIGSSNPVVDLEDEYGHRVQMSDASISPEGHGTITVIKQQSLEVDGFNVAIASFPTAPKTMDDLIEQEAVSRRAAAFLRLAVKAKANILFVGGRGSGKTTLMRACADYIPTDERVVVVEDAAELGLSSPQAVHLTTNAHLSMEALIPAALRMSPDRLIVGECRGGETAAVLQAMKSDFPGSMSALHVNSPDQILGRLEAVCMMSEMPLSSIGERVHSSLDLVVFNGKKREGSRRVRLVTEIFEANASDNSFVPVFQAEKNPVGSWRLQPTGWKPAILGTKFKAAGIEVNPSVFDPQIGD